MFDSLIISAELLSYWNNNNRIYLLNVNYVTNIKDSYDERINSAVVVSNSAPIIFIQCHYMFAFPENLSLNLLN